jgi:twitching motility protein PilT
MSSPSALPQFAAGAATAPTPSSPTFSTAALLTAMLRSSAKISDLFFSPGKPPMIEVNGRLVPTGPRALSPEDTRHIASELIGSNQTALDNLREQGSCDVS